MRYPDARRLDIVDDLHGHQVADPYRWLEDAGSDETEAWSTAQDAIVRPYLDQLPGRDYLGRRLRELMPGVISPPIVRGDRSFFYRRQPDQEHATFMVEEGDGTQRVLIDPSALSPDLTTTLDAAIPSKEGDRLAYELSEGGTEESALRIMDVETGDDIEGPIVLGRTSAVAWLPGGEEYVYVRRLPDDQLPEGEGHFHRRVWRHRVGTDPSTDQLLFGEGRDKSTYYGVQTSRDGRWLTITASIGTEPRNDLYLVDLDGDGAIVTIQEGVDAQADAHVHTDGLLYVFTDRDAPRWRLAITDPQHPTPDNWRDLLPETGDVLTDYALTDDAVVAVRTHDVVSQVTVHDKTTGAARATVALPGLGVAGVSSRPEGGDDVWISYTDFLVPTKVLRYRVQADTLETWADPPGMVEPKGISVSQVFFESKDGTRIPMFVIAPDDLTLDGNQPTILYGYGGFNISMAPAYSANIVTWTEAGGVYAIANMRGGSEYGEEWHRGGMRANKQNVFDDFIGAAEWLIANNYTSPDRLVISGGSNGGLLVGAALTQRPDLYRAVVCSAPLLDMIRYEQFGLGVTWNDEYGRADDPTEFEWLLGYSPYHHVEDGTAYPAVLFTVFDGDSRVDPLHARKLCAALQHATSSPIESRPVLIRREKNVGHGTRAVSRTIDLNTDVYAFIAAQAGVELPADGT